MQSAPHKTGTLRTRSAIPQDDQLQGIRWSSRATYLWSPLLVPQGYLPTHKHATCSYTCHNSTCTCVHTTLIQVSMTTACDTTVFTPHMHIHTHTHTFAGLTNKPHTCTALIHTICASPISFIHHIAVIYKCPSDDFNLSKSDTSQYRYTLDINSLQANLIFVRVHRVPN